MKKCSKCKKEKEDYDFNPSNHTEDGTTHRCKDCINLYERKYYKNNRDRIRNRKKISDKNSKLCKNCGREQPLNCFYKDMIKKDGLNYRCKECVSKANKNRRGKIDYKNKQKHYRKHYNKERRVQISEYWRKRRIENPDIFRERKLKENYGINLKQYDEMLLRQNSKCAICGGNCCRKFSVDHNHSTGKIRGLLCIRCNTGLGCFGDSIETLNKAKNYLEFYELVDTLSPKLTSQDMELFNDQNNTDKKD